MIEVENLSKSYNEIEVFTGISFKVGEDKKETVGILGRNGCGKTTLLNLISGCIRPDEGEVTINGFSLEKQAVKAKRCFGYVPSKSLIYPDMSVRGFLSFAGRLKGIPEKKLASAVFDSLKKVRAEYLLNTKAEKLTAFEVKLINIAQAIIASPEVLLIDAPTRELIPAEQMRIRALIRELGEEYTVLLASDQLYEVTETCSRVIILNGGRIAADRYVREFAGSTGTQLRLRVKGERSAIMSAFEPFRDDDVIFGIERSEEPGVYSVSIDGSSESEDMREKAFDCCAKNGLPILDMRRTSVSLEDIYLQLTGEGGVS